MTTTTSGKKAGGFVITGPGEYQCCDGTTIEIRASCADPVFCWSTSDPKHDGKMWDTRGRRMTRSDKRRDIIAKAPAKAPRATKASRGGKGRRYLVMRIDACWYIKEDDSTRYIQVRSRSTARKLAAMLNADAGEGVGVK